MLQIDWWSKDHWLTPTVWSVSPSLIRVGTRLNIWTLGCSFILICLHHLASVPQVSSKPSPSKRRCSEENIQPAAGEKDQEPVISRPSAPKVSDPPTDKKPPVGPASVRSSSSLEKTATRPTVQSQPGQLRTAQPEPGKMVVTPAPEPPCSTEVETADVIKENLVEQQTPSAAGMKSRLQRLVVQRKCWEDDGENICFDFTLRSSCQLSSSKFWLSRLFQSLKKHSM